MTLQAIFEQNRERLISAVSGAEISAGRKIRSAMPIRRKTPESGKLPGP